MLFETARKRGDPVSPLFYGWGLKGACPFLLSPININVPTPTIYKQCNVSR